VQAHKKVGERIARSCDQQPFRPEARSCGKRRNEQSARKAAEAFDADRWFSDPLAMIGDDQIDIITISVRVPEHQELVLAALSAGKAVYCEAPL